RTLRGSTPARGGPVLAAAGSGGARPALHVRRPPECFRDGEPGLCRSGVARRAAGDELRVARPRHTVRRRPRRRARRPDRRCRLRHETRDGDVRPAFRDRRALRLRAHPARLWHLALALQLPFSDRHLDGRPRHPTNAAGREHHRLWITGLASHGRPAGARASTRARISRPGRRGNAADGLPYRRARISGASRQGFRAVGHFEPDAPRRRRLVALSAHGNARDVSGQLIGLVILAVDSYRHLLLMTNRTSSRKGRLAGTIAVLLLVPFLQAHEGPPFPIVVDHEIGPMLVSVWTDPDIGIGTFFVVFEAAGDAVLPDDLAVQIGIRPVSGRLEEVLYRAE